MKEEWKRSIARIVGNFGISFFTPLSSSAIAQSYFTNTVNFYESIVIGLISAALITGLSISKELTRYGTKRTS